MKRDYIFTTLPPRCHYVVLTLSLKAFSNRFFGLILGLGLKEAHFHDLTNRRNLEDWKTGRLEDWKTGRLEDWKTGRLEDWKTGRLEDWKTGRLEDWMEDWKTGNVHYETNIK
ncbi:hypothetical protein GQR58_009325 [Nymphon striatum]|nr:hypothetical protein GQR58_009325 [Nymphon striatum]